MGIGKSMAMCLALILMIGMCMGHISVRAEEGDGNDLKVLHYYSFNEGDAADYFRNGKDGELVGAAEFAEGKYGQALKLGGGSFVKFQTDIIPSAGSFTISMWAYTQSEDNQNSRLISTGVWGGNTPGIELGVHTNVTADGSWADATYGIGKADADSYFGYSGAVPYEAIHEAWAHMAYVYSAEESQIKVYINGEEKGVFGCDGYQTASQMQSFALGGHLDGSSVSEAFTGLIDEVAVFGQALSAEEVVLIGSGELSAQVALPEMSEDASNGEDAASDDTPASQQTPKADNEQGMLHYYSFDEETAADYSSNGIDGEPVGNVEFAEGKFGKALKLDGGSFVKFPAEMLPIQGSFTVSMWVYNQTEDNAMARLLSTGVYGPDTPGVTLGVHTNVTSAGDWADITFGAGKDVGEGNFHFSYAVPYTTLHESWCHVVLVCDAENKLMLVYANGEEKDRLDYTDCNIASEMPYFALGGHLEGDSLGEPFTGMIDDVTIFNRALTEAEVIQMGSGKFMNTVTFETNGGSPVDPESVFAGGTVKEPESVRTSAAGEEEWKLVGWSMNPDRYESYNFEKPVREDMTLYAMWRKGDQVTVSFEGYDDLAQTFAAGNKAEEPKKPGKKGYQLSGWYLDEELTVKYNFNAAVYVDTKLYPKWTEGEAADESGFVALPWILGGAAVVIVLALAGIWFLKGKRSAENARKK